MVTVKYKDKLLLKAAGPGAMPTVLESLDAPCAEDALAVEVAAIEQALQSDAVAAVADRLAAAVPETADFGRFKAPSDN